MATEIEFFLENSLFSVEVVTKVAHRFTGVCFVNIVRVPDGYLVRLTMRESADLDRLAERFKNEALDELLRQHVREETREIHNALVNAALANAKPRGGL